MCGSVPPIDKAEEPARQAFMPTVQTSLFGPLDYEPSQLISLAVPLPGLPDTKLLLPVSQSVLEPFVFFQSIDHPHLCLLAAPARVVKRDYQVGISGEERELLRLAPGVEPGAGQETGVFAFVNAAGDRGASANLLAPLVIHFGANLALQSIQSLDEDFLRYPVPVCVSGGGLC